MSKASLDPVLLNTPECRVIHRGSVSWTTPTSSVESIPALALSGLGIDVGKAEIAGSIVTVRGRVDEALHYHHSHVIGLVIKGVGVLRTATPERPSEEQRLTLETGDLVLIPRGALHLFETDDGSEFAYLGLEVSDRPIDYQSHRYYR